MVFEPECDCIYCKAIEKLVRDAALATEIYGDDELEYYAREMDKGRY